MIKKTKKLRFEDVYRLDLQELIEEATCDICGKDCMVDDFFSKKSDGDRDDKDNFKVFEGMILKADWGFYSKNKDCEKWEAVICEDCVDKHLGMINFVKKFHG